MTARDSSRKRLVAGLASTVAACIGVSAQRSTAPGCSRNGLAHGLTGMRLRPHSTERTTTIFPAMKRSGIASRLVQPGLSPKNAMVARALARMRLFSAAKALGTPVDPLVCTVTAAPGEKNSVRNRPSSASKLRGSASSALDIHGPGVPSARTKSEADQRRPLITMPGSSAFMKSSSNTD